MSTTTVKPIVLWVLIGGLIASVALSVKIERDKRRLAGTVEQLTEDLATAQETIVAQTDQLSSLETELSALQQQLARAEQEVARLQVEQRGFRSANARLNRHAAELARENEAMRATLASVRSLKAAIRQAKATLRRERWQQWLARAEAQRLEDRLRLASGNRGYLVQDGASTAASRTAAGATAQLQVRVLEPQLE